MSSTTIIEVTPVNSTERLTPELLHAARDDLKQVNVHTSALRMSYGEGGSPFTVYTIVVSCVATKTWWIIQKRYSHFYELYQQLRKVEKKTKGKVKELHEMLQPLFRLQFPKKSLRLDTDDMMLQRKKAFNALTRALMQMRTTIVCARMCPCNTELSNELKQLLSSLDEFLAVPDRQREEEIRRASHWLSSPDDESAPSEDSCTHPLVEDDSCPICLCELKDANDSWMGETVLELNCKHSFHEGCVIQWLEQHVSCPICRQQVTGGVMH